MSDRISSLLCQKFVCIRHTSTVVRYADTHTNTSPCVSIVAQKYISGSWHSYVSMLLILCKFQKRQANPGDRTFHRCVNISVELAGIKSEATGFSGQNVFRTCKWSHRLFDWPSFLYFLSAHLKKIFLLVSVQCISLWLINFCYRIAYSRIIVNNSCEFQ